MVTPPRTEQNKDIMVWYQLTLYLALLSLSGKRLLVVDTPDKDIEHAEVT